MKKFFSLVAIVLTAVMLVTCIPAFADNGDVEISFKVGDSTLLINGAPTTVVTPYVVGEGTTLVPVRVITEAFGAKVDWDDSTKTAILEYEGVKILLQIGNIVAEVNGKAETLLAAPELTKDTTMVPLRFISETFDAVVSYDENTKGITVTKKASSEGSTVESGVDSKNIGDSYYGWVMEKPAEMQMDYRSFDGAYTSFAYDENNYIYIDIYGKDPEYDLEEDFAAAKESVEGLTLIKAEKSSDANSSKVHIQTKNQLYYHDVQKIVTDKYEIRLYGVFENEKAQQRDAWIKTLSTFKVTFNGTDTYDLSDIEDGMRTYEAKSVNLTFDVPQEFYLSSSDYAVNEFDFYNLDYTDNFSGMHVSVYSKSEVGSPKELAEKDYTGNKNAFSPDVLKFCDGVTQRQYETISAYEYTYDYETSIGTGTCRDVFFELGDYVYNVSVSLNSTFGDTTARIDKIINSIKAEPIDASEVGILMRNEPEEKGTYTSEPTGYKLTLPKIYSEDIGSTEAIYQHAKNGILISFSGVLYADTDYNEVKKTLKSYETAYKEDENVTIITSTSDITINGVKYAHMVMREKDEISGYMYADMYIAIKNDGLVSFTVLYPEMSYSEKAVKEVRDIIATLK